MGEAEEQEHLRDRFPKGREGGVATVVREITKEVLVTVQARTCELGKQLEGCERVERSVMWTNRV